MSRIRSKARGVFATLFSECLGGWRMRLRLCAVLLALCPAVHALQVVTVLNRGVPGQNTADIDVRTATELATYAPDVVVLFAGMNDAVNEKKFLSPAESLRHIRSIVQTSTQAHARVVLVTVHVPDVTRLMQRHTKAAYGDRPPEQRIGEMNAVLTDAASAGALPLVDFATLLKTRGGATTAWSTDGVHLTANGYALLAQAVATRLMTMGHVRTVLCLGDSLTYGTGVREANTPEPDETYPRQLERLLRH